ncbi:MAG: DUF6475 domain-containing protein [Candidatus Berkiella sp.]
MHISEREEFVKLLMGIAGIYGVDLSDVMLKIYWKILEIYSWKDVAKALRLHTEDPDIGQFMPKPADVIRIIRGSSQSICFQAWSKVERAIRIVGPYYSVVFDDITIHAVIDEMGGWVKLCRVTERDLNFVVREFQTRYTSYKYQLPESYPSKLVGLTDHYNLTQGYSLSEVILIGEVEQAKLILEKGIKTKHAKIQRFNNIAHHCTEVIHV